LEKFCAELSVRVKKERLNETRTLKKWQQLIGEYQRNGVDVSDGSFSSVNERTPIDEIRFVLRSGERTQIPNYKEMYALLGEFIRFLHDEISYVGTLKISLERKCLVFEIQTQLP
jgi:hypothetical protein